MLSYPYFILLNAIQQDNKSPHKYYLKITAVTYILKTWFPNAYIKKLYFLYSSTNRVHCINVKWQQITFFDKSYSEKKEKYDHFELNNSVYIGKKCPWTTWKTVRVIILLSCFLLRISATFFCWRCSTYLRVECLFKSVALDGQWHLTDVLPDCVFFKENIV